MPLLLKEELAPTVRLGLWQISEQTSDFLCRFSQLEVVAQRYKNEGRRLQKLAAYALLYAMTGDEGAVIKHDERGKPLLNLSRDFFFTPQGRAMKNLQISVSDTKGFVAIMLGERRVGVDIEYMSDRVARVASRFMREDELVTSIEAMLVHWSAKETVYKYFSEEDLLYNEMRLAPFTLQNEGIVETDNLKSGLRIPVVYRVSKDYVLTYAFQNS